MSGSLIYEMDLRPVWENGGTVDPCPACGAKVEQYEYEEDDPRERWESTEVRQYFPAVTLTLGCGHMVDVVNIHWPNGMPEA